MRIGLLVGLCFLVCHDVTFGQEAAPSLGAPLLPGPIPGEPYPLKTWGSVEYLTWWIKGQPAPGPLVTTGDPNSATAGFLTDPSTTVLYGDSRIHYSAFSGARMVLGCWLDVERITGVEFSGFYLNRRSTSYQASSDPTGLPILAMPITNPDGGPGALYAASNGLQVANIHGTISVSTSSRLLGGELNEVLNFWRVQDDMMELFIGLRYLDLEEDLQTRYLTTAVKFDGTVAGNDSFNTRSHFYGAQFGGRWTGNYGKWSTTMMGSLSLGATDQVVAVGGTTTVSGTAVQVPGTFPGFLYSQPTNIGQLHRCDFSVVPQIQLKLGYDLLRNVRLTCGYDFLYWTNVLRAADQIDHTVNVTQMNPVSFPNSNLKLIGEPRPAPVMNRSEFWAQGVSFGVEVRW